MAMKAIVTEEEFGALSEGFQKEYKKVGESYRLDVTPVNGFTLDDVVGLKKVLQEVKTERTNLKGRLETFKDLDPEEARKALSKVSEFGNLTSDEKVREMIDQERQKVEKKYETKLGESEGRSSLLTNELNRILIESNGVQAILKHEGNSDLLLPIVSRYTKTEEVDGKFFSRVIDDEGNVRITQKTGSTAPMDIDELVESFKEDPRYMSAFKGAEAAGSGLKSAEAGSGGSNGKFTISAADAKDPQKYRALRAEAEKVGQTVEINMPQNA